MLLEGTQNIDVLIVGTVASSILFLGFTVLFSGERSKVNLAFFLLTAVTTLWGIANFLIYQTTNADFALWMLRTQAFFAVLQAFLLFEFTQLFVPSPYQVFNRFKWIKYSIVTIVATLTLTPLMFAKIVEIDPIAGLTQVEQGLGFAAFGILNLIFVAGTFALYLRNLRGKKKEGRKSLAIIATGSFLAFFLIIFFNFFLPGFLENVTFVPFALVFFSPIIIFTTYAILKHKLFNAKAIVVGLLTFFLSAVNLSEVIFSESSGQFLFAIGQFFLILVIGILLLRSVVKEVQQRERIETLARDLEKANARLKELDRLKSEFVSIASHQLRSPLTAIKGYASLILEGSFGTVNDAVREAVQKMFDSSNLMAVSVQDFLDVSRIEQGKMKYNFEDFDLKKLLQTVVEELTPVAKTKGLSLTLKITEEKFLIHADLGKIKQVLYNLIDNSIKYTPDGSVDVLMHQVEDKIRVEIHDTGVGIAPETLPKLFDKFVRSRNAHHVNVSGTGLGLFVVKQMIEAHKGRVWATSEGEGKGSVFHVELRPVK